MMGENTEITLAESPTERPRGWISRKLEEMAVTRARKKEEKRMLSENEQAIERMSGIAWRLRELLDSDSFRGREIPNEQSIDPLRKEGHVYIHDFQEKDYSINVDRDTRSGQAFEIEVYTSPSDREHYSTGINDGYFRIYFREDPFHHPKKNERKRLSWDNTSIYGDIHLGKETSEIIDELQVDDIATRVHLRGVDFGGWPTVHVTLNAEAKDSTGNYLGPIGKIDNLWVLGVSRASQPVKNRIMDSDSEEIKITDEFDRAGIPFRFDRGEANFEVAKTKGEGGKEILAFKFSGIRKRFSGDRDHPIIGGPETKILAVPTTFVNGFTVIDLFEKAVNSTIAACEVKPQLMAKNP